MTNTPTRRAIISGTFHDGNTLPTSDEYISSAVISVLPAKRAEIMARLEALPGAEVHHSNASKLVVVLEGPDSGSLGGMLAEISGWPGVLSANMVYEQRLEEEPLR